MGITAYVIYDKGGRWLIGFTKQIGKCSVFNSDLWGFYEGLLCAWSTGVRICYACHKRFKWYMWCTKGNMLTDGLSKIARRDDLLYHRFFDAPNEVLHILHEDVSSYSELK
ncbi:hypothetical protein V6N11_039933 [Hibiscus sabdariffa]|uniref:RNase H type-1 domain-containing protein n=1 Tax=Hibiscus sabdariffa TaxID=183260 RepID=A0ABR2RG72_9ROSI